MIIIYTRFFDNYNKGLERIIDMLAYDIYIIRIDKNNLCKCRHIASKQPDANCKLCLGLGYKIKIHKEQGYQNDEKIAIRSAQNTENILSTIYYVKTQNHLHNEKIIVDRDEVYTINRGERYKSSNNRLVFKKFYCVPKKSMSQVFLKNFYDIVR